MYKKILIFTLFLFLLNSCGESKIENIKKNVKEKTKIEQNSKEKSNKKITEKEIKEKIEKKLVSNINEFGELGNFLKINLNLEEKKSLKKSLKEVLGEEKTLEEKIEKILKEAEKKNKVKESLNNIKELRKKFYNKIIKYVGEKQKEEFKKYCFPKIEVLKGTKEEFEKIKKQKNKESNKNISNNNITEKNFIKNNLKQEDIKIIDKKKKKLLGEEKDLNSKLEKLFVNLEKSKKPEEIIKKADELRQKYYNEMLPYIKEKDKENFKKYCFPSDEKK